MPGTWTLFAPDGRTWDGDSPLSCAGAEQRSRIPADIALARVLEMTNAERETTDETHALQHVSPLVIAAVKAALPTVRLYAFQPNGHGELSFFVVAESEAQAKQYLDDTIAVRSKLDMDDDLYLAPYYYAGWNTDYYTLKVAEVGQVLVNNND